MGTMGTMSDMKTLVGPAALVLAVMWLAGCPGEANIPGQQDGGDLTWQPLPDFGFKQDGGGWIPTDTGLPPDGPQQALDNGVVPPDLKLSSNPGDPCPCAAPLHCVAGKCRKQCTYQQCNGLGGCASNEACLMTTPQIPVCMPGVGPGQACSAPSPCAGGLLCLTTDQTATTGTCYPTCTTKGAACPTGGTCYEIPQNPCLFCY